MIAQMRGFCNARKRFIFSIIRHLSPAKTAFPFRKAAIIFHFSPVQVILSIHLRECRPKAFPECSIAPALPAAWHIRQSAHTPNLLFCTRRIALHARQAVLYLPGDTSNPSENDIPALASQNPSQTNARRMATIPRYIGKVTAHGSFDSTASVTPAKIH